MAQSLRHIKSRIRSIENTRKLTRAMEMISISKLRRGQEAVVGAQAYFSRIESLLMDVLPSGADFRHPLLAANKDNPAVAVCVITSDTGLCSAYNHSILYVAEQFLRGHDKAAVKLVTVGKKGFINFTKRGYSVVNSYTGLNGRFSESVSAKVLQQLIDLYRTGQVSQVYAVSMQPKGLTHYKPVLQKLLPIERAQATYVERILEPEVNEMLDSLIPEYLSSTMRMLLMHAFAAEHQARAISMGEATQNATELLEALVLKRNKMRQANITREIIEIISSAEALKG